MMLLLCNLTKGDKQLSETDDESIYDYLDSKYGDAAEDMTDDQFMTEYKNAMTKLNIVTSGGELDVDSNPDCEIDNINNENITFTDAATVSNGEYIVNVDFYGNCMNSEKTRYTVTARYKGELISPISGQNPYTGILLDGTDSYTQDSSSQEAMRFSISDAKAVSVAQFHFQANGLKSGSATELRAKMMKKRK